MGKTGTAGFWRAEISTSAQTSHAPNGQATIISQETLRGTTDPGLRQNCNAIRRVDRRPSLPYRRLLRPWGRGPQASPRSGRGARKICIKTTRVTLVSMATTTPARETVSNHRLLSADALDAIGHSVAKDRPDRRSQQRLPGASSRRSLWPLRGHLLPFGRGCTMTRQGRLRFRSSLQ